MAIVKEKNTNRKTVGDSARKLNLVTPSGTETGSLQPGQLKLWQAMLDSLEPVAMLLRKDTREIVACNKAAREQGATLGKTCFQSWAKRETPCTWCRASEVWETGKTIRCQPEGDGRIWDMHWDRITDDLYLHYVQDITEQRGVEKELMRYRCMVSSSSDMIALLDKNFVYLAANEKYMEPFGLTRRELIGSSVKDVFGVTFFETVIRPNAERCLLGNRVSFCDTFVFPTLGERYMEITYDPFLGPDNKIIGFLVNGRDITERKRAEEALFSSNAKLQGYIDNAPDGLLVANGQGRFMEANPAVCRMLGYSEEELLQLTVPEILASESQEDGRKHFAQVVGEGSAHGEFVGLRKDGSTFYYIVDAVKVNEDRFMGFIKDISGRRTAELSLMSQTHDLGERIKELGGLYGLSRLTTDKDLNPEQVFQQAAELLPPAWHYPEITCGRIVIHKKVYTTDNYADTGWKQSAKILVSGVPIGIIEVAYLTETPELFEGPFMREERSLINGMAQILGQYIERVQHESRLRESNARLVEEQLALESKNTALSEVMEHVDREKKDTGFQIQSNISRLVIPMIAKLEAQASDAQQPFLSILKNTLDEITSPFVTRLERDRTSLSPREVEICNLIKSGLSSKDIATALNTSEATVRTQRKNIRKKLGLSKSNTNLTNYLQQI